MVNNLRHENQVKIEFTLKTLHSSSCLKWPSHIKRRNSWTWNKPRYRHFFQSSTHFLRGNWTVETQGKNRVILTTLKLRQTFHNANKLWNTTIISGNWNFMWKGCRMILNYFNHEHPFEPSPPPPPSKKRWKIECS